jgi:hypothetical protein
MVWIGAAFISQTNAPFLVAIKDRGCENFLWAESIVGLDSEADYCQLAGRTYTVSLREL